jgi:arylsulfatase
MQHAHRAVHAFEESTKKEQLIPSGSPLNFVPKAGAEAYRVKHER